MNTNFLRKWIPLILLLNGLAMGFQTFVILFNTAHTAILSNLIPVFIAILFASFVVVILLGEGSFKNSVLLCAPPVLAVLFPLLTVAQTAEVYQTSMVAILVLIICAFVFPIAFKLRNRKK